MTNTLVKEAKERLFGRVFRITSRLEMHPAERPKKNAQWAQPLETRAKRGLRQLKVVVHRVPLSVPAILLTVLSACATKEEAAGPPQPENGIQEYRNVTTQALHAIHAALDSLNLVGAQTNSCPPTVVEAFGAELQRLQIESIQVRERAQAILARGDAYFENWSENLARMKDPRVRDRAAHYRSELQESFLKLKLASQQSRTAFRDFFDGLRKLRISLEKDPSSIQTEATKDLIRTTQHHGQEISQQLAAVSAELDAMTQMLTPDH